MRPFTFDRAADADAALRAVGTDRDAPPVRSTAQFLAGGTTMLDLMKLDVMRPERLVDINALAGSLGAITADANGPAPRRPGPHGGGRRSPGGQARLAGGRAELGAGGQRPAPQHGQHRRERAATNPLQLLPRRVLDRLQQARARVRMRGPGGLQPVARGAGHERALHRQLPRRLRPGPARTGRNGRFGRPRRPAHHALRGAAPPAGEYAGGGNHAAARRADHRVHRAGPALGAAFALPEGARPGKLRLRRRLRRGGDRHAGGRRAGSADRARRRRHRALASARCPRPRSPGRS